MIRLFILLLSGSLMICTKASGQKVKNTGYTKHDLQEIETEYSELSQTKGFKAATFFYASDSAIVFRPGEINAISWAATQSDSIFGLRWYPSSIEMSAAGDLGYSTGPFENHYDENDTAKFILGQYATVWQRQKDGSLKFIMDFGTNRLPADFKLAKEPPYNEIREGLLQAIKIKRTNNAKAFGKVEADFEKICKNDNDLAALKMYAAQDIKLFYQRKFYVSGIDSALSILTPLKSFHEWKIKKINAAISGDLVHIYGTHEFIDSGTRKSGYFMRIWKKQDDQNWKIVLQVVSVIDK